MELVDAITLGRVSTLLLWCSVYFFSSVVLRGSKAWMTVKYRQIGDNIAKDIRTECVKKLGKLSGRWYSEMNSAEIIKIMEDDISQIESVTTSMYLSYLNEILISFALLGWVALLKQVDLLILFLALQIFTLFYHKKFQDRATTISKEFRSVLSKRGCTLMEYVCNLMQHTINQTKVYFQNKCYYTEDEYIQADVSLTKTFSIASFFLSAMGMFSVVTVLGVGGYKVVKGSMTVGALLAFNMYAQSLVSPILSFAQLQMDRRKADVSLDKIWGLLDTEPDIIDPKIPLAKEKVMGDILINGVSFSYGKQPTVQNVTVELHAKQCKAIVGESGSGKTTLLNLLYRLWDVDFGEIMVDGENIKNFGVDFLRSQISIISQDVYIFDDTILMNINIGEDVTYDKVKEVAKIAQIHDWIESLPLGYQTIVGEKGTKLSGGQKQRISIARALIKDVPILVFDEATSALDFETEHNLYKDIRTHFREKTILIVTHRLDSIQFVDEIYVMRAGSVIEKGTHQELVSEHGLYYAILNNDVLVK